MGGKGSAPPPPNYVAAAEAQAEASKELTNIQNFANRPTINTPFGSQSWNTSATTDPATGQTVTSWTQNNTLAPGLQSALDAQVGLQNSRSQLASGFMGRVANEYGQPFDYQNLPQMATGGGPLSLQGSTSDYTRGLETNVPSRSNQVTGAFGFGGPQMGVSTLTSGLDFGAQNQPVQTEFSALANGVQGAVPQTQLDANFNPMTSALTTGVGTTPLITDFKSNNYQLARNTGTEQLQRGLATADNPALPQFDGSYRDTVANTLMARMQPLHERQQAQLETQLANQGFRVGSEGYKRALDELNQRQAAERFNALDTAGNEAMRLFNMGMGARQQAFNEDVTGGQFANQAANQAFQQGLSANQFQNAAAAQAFNQQMGAKQAYNQAQQQAFNQNLAAGQFGNSAVQQAYAQALGAQQAANDARNQQFAQGLQAGQFGNAANAQAYNQLMGAQQAANAARAQAFSQDVTNTNLNNQAIQQAFGQQLAAGQFGNQAQQQLYNQIMGQADLQNRAAGQQFSQDLASQQFRNQALGQASALDIARMQAMNQAAQQQFGMNQQAAAFQNQLRQQAIAEQMQRRGMSLNEMNALLSGQQVTMPNMPSFAAAQRSETPNILGATQMGYDAALGAYNAQQAGASNMMGGLFSLGSAALGNPYAAAGLFGFGR